MKSKLQEQFEKETGLDAIIFPACHGEMGFASHPYQLWLESYASQSAGQVSEVWVRIREENGNLIALALPEPNDKNTYHWIYFSKEHDTVITNFIGTIESVIAFRKHHLNENYTHYCLFKNPTI